MVAAIAQAIELVPNIDPFAMHNKMRTLYSWPDVAQRTERVYHHAMNTENEDLLERLSRYNACGPWAGKLFCLVVIIDYIFWHFLQWWQPAEEIDVAPDFQRQEESPEDGTAVGIALKPR
ncbi:hypothetical protein R1flu_001379 [Riccia fluitans]|uniref:Uncharacterized protein n=1 Tax=Riccia fluitans TaxID=41844 RepID=A0ABD1Y437_9MARC